MVHKLVSSLSRADYEIVSAMNKMPVPDDSPDSPDRKVSSASASSTTEWVADSVGGSKASRGRFQRAGIAIVIGLLLGLGIGTVRALQVVDARSIVLGFEGIQHPIAILLVGVVVGAMMLLWRRPTAKKLLFAGIAMVMAIGISALLFRVDSFYGSLMPRLVWRWTPSAERMFESYQSQRPSLTEPPGTAVTVVETPGDHPGFLGAQRNGRVSGVRIDPDWQRHTPVELWRHPVGLGWGGFAVVGDLAVTQEQRGENESIVAYHRQTGVELWCHQDRARFTDTHGNGPRATPTIAHGRVFTMGATGILNCLDASSGSLIWQQATLPADRAANLLWGMAGSPLVVDELVIVSPGAGSRADAGQGRALVAYRLDDGAQAWASGDDPAAYASPMLVEFSGQKQILTFNGAGLRGFTLDGSSLWFFPWLTQGEQQRVNVAQPVVLPRSVTGVHAGQVLISSGYGMGTSLLEVQEADSSWNVHERWHSQALKSKLSNFVCDEGYIYGLDNGILTCLELTSGRLVWKQGRLGHGQMLLVPGPGSVPVQGSIQPEDRSQAENSVSGPQAGAGMLLIQSESGEVVLVAASPEGYREYARLSALADKTWNHAALSGEYLIVRNDREAACFQLPCIP